MIEKLKSYLDGLFAAVPATDEVREAKDELYDSMVERYEDCIKEGMDEQAAYDCVVDSIGDIHELFAELDFSEADAGKDSRADGQNFGEQFAKEIGDFVQNVTDFASGLVTGFFGEPGPGGMSLVNSVSLPLDGVESIDISYLAEGVTLQYSSDDNLVVNEYMNREDPTLFAETRLTKGNVSVRHGRRSGMFGLRSRIEVFLPQSYAGSLAISTVSGRIHTEGEWNLAGFAAKAVSGDVEVSSVTAENVRISSTSGSVGLARGTGNMDLRTVSGNIRVDAAVGGGTFGTTSGGLRVNFEELTGPIKLSSISGGVRLGLPEDVSFELDASSISGSINTAFDAALTFQKRNKAYGFVGAAPYHNIKISTTAGGIHIND